MNDIVNAVFVLVGSLLLTLNVHQLYKDKILKGIHYAPTAFFTAWGIWNIFYYTQLGQYYSFYAGIVLVVVNVTWLSMAIYYGRTDDSER